MSEHKTGHSNWTAEQKQLYRGRREKGLPGQVKPGIIKTGPRLSRGRQPTRRAMLRQQWRAFTRVQRKASARGM